jgi:hypothetical protein
METQKPRREFLHCLTLQTGIISPDFGVTAIVPTAIGGWYDG